MTIPSQKQPPSDDSIDPMEELNNLARSFSPEEKARLLQLARELQTQPDEIENPTEQIELLTYFQQKMKAVPGDHPFMQANDTFLKHLTVAEFWALPEPEQARLWHEAYRAIRLAKQSQLVRADAIPAR